MDIVDMLESRIRTHLDWAGFLESTPGAELLPEYKHIGNSTHHRQCVKEYENFIEQVQQLQAKIEQLEAELDPIREWYGSGTEGNRSDVEVLHAAIADLQDDRQAVLMLREDKANLKAELDKWKPKPVYGTEANREVKE